MSKGRRSRLHGNENANIVFARISNFNIFLRINLPKLMQFKDYWEIVSGSRVLLF